MTDETIRRETTKFLHEQIPITKAMGVEVESIAGGSLVLTAPLAANHNHLGTAFGGSLGAIATLAGYGLLWLQLGDRSAHIVIKSSSLRYLHPVRGGIRAVCKAPDGELLAEFKAAFAKKDKARIRLVVTIEEDDRVCVEFEGEYVAMR
ncbi:MAG: YiiD C-terminal domain-containing protein [Luteolibacter sp.]|uniref:YiiD C-terminal domain-containing protein n=1 Tax=Luteolibacter sp. TaxID=1962973 RepID=UPI0032660326